LGSADKFMEQVISQLFSIFKLLNGKFLKFDLKEETELEWFFQKYRENALSEDTLLALFEKIMLECVNNLNDAHEYHQYNMQGFCMLFGEIAKHRIEFYKNQFDTFLKGVQDGTGKMSQFSENVRMQFIVKSISQYGSGKTFDTLPKPYQELLSDIKNNKNIDSFIKFSIATMMGSETKKNHDNIIEIQKFFGSKITDASFDDVVDDCVYSIEKNIASIKDNADFATNFIIELLQWATTTLKEDKYKILFQKVAVAMPNIKINWKKIIKKLEKDKNEFDIICSDIGKPVSEVSVILDTIKKCLN
jgi:hypothetical protein